MLTRVYIDACWRARAHACVGLCRAVILPFPTSFTNIAIIVTLVAIV